MQEEEWNDIIDTVYKIVSQQVGRGKPYDKTLSRALNVSAQYEVYFIRRIIENNV